MTRRIILVDIGSGLMLSGVLPSVSLFSAYSAKLSARGGVVPYVYSISAGALPDGLFIDSGTGIISGTTSAAGTATFTVRVTDLSGAFLDRQFAITVIAEPLTLSGHAGNGTVGTAYAYTYAASGGIPPYAWSIVSGALPSGVTLNASTGQLSGTPTAGGALSWTVRVTDSASATADLPDTATFAYSTLTLAGTYAAAAVGTAYSSDLTISGGNGTYSNPRVTSGSLPAGLALSIVGNKLRLSGTPTTAATSAFTAAVDSSDGQTATSPQSVAVSGSAVTWWSLHASPFLTLSNGDRTLTNTANTWHAALATLARDAATSNHYFEVKFDGGSYLSVGLLTTVGSTNHEVGFDADGYGYIYDGTKENHSVSSAYGASFAAGDVLGVLLKNGNLYFRKNGTWQNSANVIAETGYAYSGLSGSFYPAAALYDTSAAATGRFSATDITGSLPSGTSAWQ